jgi:hypothetical protein
MTQYLSDGRTTEREAGVAAGNVQGLAEDQKRSPLVKVCALSSFNRGPRKSYTVEGELVVSPQPSAKPGDILFMTKLDAQEFEHHGLVSRLGPHDRVYVDGIEVKS